MGAKSGIFLVWAECSESAVWIPTCLFVRMAASVKIAALPKFWCRAHERMLRKQSEKNEGRESPHTVSSVLSRFGWCSEGRQYRLQTQHRDQPLDVSFAPPATAAQSSIFRWLQRLPTHLPVRRLSIGLCCPPFCALVKAGRLAGCLSSCRSVSPWPFALNASHRLLPRPQ